MFLSSLDLFLQCVSVKICYYPLFHSNAYALSTGNSGCFISEAAFACFIKAEPKNRGKKNRLCLSVFLCLCRRNLPHILGFLFIQRPAACDKDAAEQRNHSHDNKNPFCPGVPDYRAHKKRRYRHGSHADCRRNPADPRPDIFLPHT